MSSAAGAASKRALLAEDVPWRASPAGRKPVPRIHLNPVLRVQQNPRTNYAVAVMKVCRPVLVDSTSLPLSFPRSKRLVNVICVMQHPDPVGGGFAMEARLEAAGPDCIVPGLATPVKLLGIKVSQ